MGITELSNQPAILSKPGMTRSRKLNRDFQFKSSSMTLGKEERYLERKQRSDEKNCKERKSKKFERRRDFSSYLESEFSERKRLHRTLKNIFYITPFKETHRMNFTLFIKIFLYLTIIFECHTEQTALAHSGRVSVTSI